MHLWKASTLALTLALGVVVGGSIAAAHEQPHMQSALDHLKAAKTALQAASHDHGGHRSKALKLTEQAIKEVQDGIEFASKHDKGNGPGPKGDGPGPKGGGPNPKGDGPAPK